MQIHAKASPKPKRRVIGIASKPTGPPTIDNAEKGSKSISTSYTVEIRMIQQTCSSARPERACLVNRLMVLGRRRGALRKFRN